MSRGSRTGAGGGRIAGLALATLLLGACATYRPRPLGTHPDLATSLAALKLDRAALPRALRRRPFAPDRGLDMTETVMLAVVNNPGLKAARRELGIAGAQLYRARLWPDPELSLSADHPTDNTPGLTSAYSIGLNYNLQTVLTHGAGVHAAAAGAQQVDLTVLWQEWQVAQQARVLFVRAVTEERELALLKRFQRLYAANAARSRRALASGDVTLTVAGADLTALLDANSRVDDMRRALSQTRLALNALLGLAPAVPVRLIPGEVPPAFTRAQLDAALAQLPARRPDLLALAAGYRSEEQRLRQAVWAQFPALSVGLAKARDTTDVHTIGVGITLTLPLFNRNRGDIAVARATRARLWQQYQARLDDAYGKTDALWSQERQLTAQLAQVRAGLPTLRRLAANARRAYAERDIAALDYLNLQNTLLNKELEAANLEQSALEARVALQTLLGMPWTVGAAPKIAVGGGS